MRASSGLFLVWSGLIFGLGQTAPAAENTLAWSFVVNTGDRLTVDAPAGSVHLRYEKGSALVVKLVETFANPDEAAWTSIRADYEIGILQEGSEVMCVYRPKKKLSGSERPIVTDFEITLPEPIAASIRVASGDLNVDGVVRAPLTAVCGSGAIRIADVAAPLSILTVDGSTKVEHISPEAKLVQVHSWTGEVELGLERDGAYAVSIASATITNPRSASELAPVMIYRGETGMPRVSREATGGHISVEDLKLKVSTRTATRLEGRTKVGGTRVKVSTGGGDARLVGLPAEAVGQ